MAVTIDRWVSGSDFGLAPCAPDDHREKRSLLRIILLFEEERGASASFLLEQRESSTSRQGSP